MALRVHGRADGDDVADDGRRCPELHGLDVALGFGRPDQRVDVDFAVVAEAGATFTGADIAESKSTVEVVGGLMMIVIGVMTVMTGSMLQEGGPANMQGFFGQLPLTTDLSSWYAGRTIIGLLFLVVLAGYGFWISLAGRPLFARDFLPDQMEPSRQS